MKISKTTAARFSQARKRNSRGSSLVEFPLALFLFLFTSFFPACNLVCFCSVYLSLQHLTERTVKTMAMSDNSLKAEIRGKELLNDYKNPFLTLLHQVRLDSSERQPAYKMQIVVNEDSKESEAYDIKEGLPKDKEPGFGTNRDKLFYAYKLQVNCIINPIFNLSAIPVIGQVPAMGCPANLKFSAQTTTENLEFFRQP